MGLVLVVVVVVVVVVGCCCLLLVACCLLLVVSSTSLLPPPLDFSSRFRTSVSLHGDARDAAIADGGSTATLNLGTWRLASEDSQNGLRSMFFLGGRFFLRVFGRGERCNLMGERGFWQVGPLLPSPRQRLQEQSLFFLNGSIHIFSIEQLAVTSCLWWFQTFLLSSFEECY